MRLPAADLFLLHIDANDLRIGLRHGLRVVAEDIWQFNLPIRLLISAVLLAASIPAIEQ